MSAREDGLCELRIKLMGDRADRTEHRRDQPEDAQKVECKGRACQAPSKGPLTYSCWESSEKFPNGAWGGYSVLVRPLGLKSTWEAHL